MGITDLLTRNPIVALIQAEDPDTAIATAHALSAGGLRVIEVVFRTKRALECLQAVADSVPDSIAGAGTVLDAVQARSALDHGAKFIVSPGLNDDVVSVARERDVPVYPGIMTPSEAQHAVNLGLDTVKFFPASIAGGVPALKSLASVFRSLTFMPTGGVNPRNLPEFLSVDAVIACGGSWLTPQNLIQKGDYDAVTALASEALAIAHTVRGKNNE